MDIRAHLTVLRNWRRVLAAGLVLATALAFLAAFKPTLGGLEWRSEGEYDSFSRAMVTQSGFPLGRATLPPVDPTQPIPDEEQQFGPPERFAGLAELYGYLGISEPIRELISPRPLEEQISVRAPVGSTGDPLPLLEVNTTADSPAGAQDLNAAVIDALETYITENAQQSGVPAAERVRLTVLNPPKPGELVSGRSPTPFAMVWLLVMAATVGLIYVLENLYAPRPTEGAILGTGPTEEKTAADDAGAAVSDAGAAVSAAELELVEASRSVARPSRGGEPRIRHRQ